MLRYSLIIKMNRNTLQCFCLVWAFSSLLKAVIKELRYTYNLPGKRYAD